MADAAQANTGEEAQPASKESSAKDSKKKSRPEPAKDAATSSQGPNVAAHPRAARSVALAKGWGGLAGFLVAGYLSLPTSTLAAAGLRALVAGSICYVAAWAAAVFVWRRLVMIEMRGREEQLREGAKEIVARRESPAPVLERPGARTAS